MCPAGINEGSMAAGLSPGFVVNWGDCAGFGQSVFLPGWPPLLVQVMD